MGHLDAAKYEIETNIKEFPFLDYRHVLLLEQNMRT